MWNYLIWKNDTFIRETSKSKYWYTKRITKFRYTYASYKCNANIYDEFMWSNLIANNFPVGKHQLRLVFCYDAVVQMLMRAFMTYLLMSGQICCMNFHFKELYLYRNKDFSNYYFSEKNREKFHQKLQNDFLEV